MHYFRKFVILFFLIFVLTGCDSKNNTLVEIPDTTDIPASYNDLIDDARLGRGNAQMIFAEMYDKGEDVPRNIDKSIAWYNIIIANNSNNIDAHYNVALLHLEKKEIKKSISMFEKAASLGDIEAANQLAEIYDNNQNFDDNYKKAFYWTKFSADKGDTFALFNLASMYNSGKGVKLDKLKGHELNLKAEKLGKVDSMYFTGKDYYDGIIVSKNVTKAYMWIKKSINNANFGSDLKLYQERTIELKKMEKELTPEQIAKVNKELGISK
ncbi:MAG: tetratricopeptide repeat protein [Thiohalomonadales bacterium]